MTATTTPGAPCWIELFTHDTDGARRFYGELFGWEAWEASEEFGGYFMFAHRGVPIAGCMPNDGSMGGPSTWSTYLHTSDVSRTAKLVAEHGGKVDVEPMPVGDAGTMASLTDPTGAVVGLWQPGDHPGFVTTAEPGAPAWFELLTDGYDTAVDFYRQALGWDVHVLSDTPEFRYATLGAEEVAQAGIMDAAAMLAGQPSRWQLYLAVADTDATVAQARALGGSVEIPAEDTPHGRLAGLVDPAGVPVKVTGPNRG